MNSIMIRPDTYFSQILKRLDETETKNVFEDFSKNKEVFDFSNYSAKSNITISQAY